MGDHLFSESILQGLQQRPVADDEVVLAVDPHPDSNRLVDPGDVTRVLADDGRVIDIGKDLLQYTAYDTGIFLCSHALFDALEESIRRGDSSLSGGIRVLAGMGRAKTFGISGDFWIDIDDADAYRKAEREMLDRLKKPNDGPVSRHLNRPISTRISKHLVATGVTPNQISIFTFALALLAAAFFMAGGYAALVAGGILAELSSIIDGCDGEVARLTYGGTAFGGWFDSVLDRYADGFIIFGLTYAVFAAGEPLAALFAGFLALIGTFLNSYTADRYDGLMQGNASAGRRRFLRIGRDVRIFIILVGALAAQPLAVLAVLALLMNAENIRRVVVLHRAG